MYCQDCGQKITEGSVFCEHCRAKPEPKIPPCPMPQAAPRSVLGPVAAVTAAVVLVVCTASYILFFSHGPAERGVAPSPHLSVTETVAAQAQTGSVLPEESRLSIILPSGGKPISSAASSISATVSIKGQLLTVRLAETDRTGFYTGQVNRFGLPHGQGVFVEEGAGCRYEGAWIDGEASGTGALSDGGHLFEGEFTHGSISGHCRISIDGITRYDGQYKNGQLHGEGTLYTKSGALLYAGEFAHNLLVETAAAREARGLEFAEQCAGMDKKTYETIMSGDGPAGQSVAVWGDVLGLSAQDASGTIIVGHMGDAAYPVSLLYRYGADEAKVKADQYLSAWGVVIGHFEFEDADGLMTRCPLVEVIYLRPRDG